MLLDESQQSLIERHLSLVLEANKQVNLTRISDEQRGRLLHVEDSLSAYEMIMTAPSGLYVDLGTGGGFPGIPLAIATHRSTLLVDARRKKVALLDQFVNVLGLGHQIQTYAGRAEELGSERPDSCAVVTARALAPLSVVMELASPLLIKDGRLVCYKGRVPIEEEEHARALESTFGLELFNKEEFLLSDGETHRSLYEYVKIGKPRISLPRRTGLAQKKPL